MPSFNPQSDIPDLAGKICLVTGGNSGLGEATAKALAQHNPAKLYLATRSRPKGEEALARIRSSSPAAASASIDILPLDLASFASVKTAAARVISEVDRLDILQLNGGVAVVPHSKTESGYEIQFGTNYIGHALLTQLLMPKLLATASLPGADVRIVAMSSIGHKGSPKEGIVFDRINTDIQEETGSGLYGQAMLAKNLFASELARRYPQVTSSSLHPGTVKTQAWEGDKDFNPIFRALVVRPFVKFMGVSCDEGAKTQLWLSFSNDVRNGAYYEPIGKLGKQSNLSRDTILAKKLWEWTEKELAATGASGWPSAK